MIKYALQEELPSTWKVLEEFRGILKSHSKRRAPQFLNLCGDFGKIIYQKTLVGERPRKT